MISLRYVVNTDLDILTIIANKFGAFLSLKVFLFLKFDLYKLFLFRPALMPTGKEIVKTNPWVLTVR